MLEKILRMQPHLVYYNKNNISNRLKPYGMFVAFNGFTKNYEIHSFKSFKYDKNSLQDSTTTDEILNQYLIRDIKANNHERFVLELEGERRRLEHLQENHQEQLSEVHTLGIIQGIERMLGRRF
jgi:hypothetical protein